jgi:hypothetical protein
MTKQQFIVLSLLAFIGLLLMNGSLLLKNNSAEAAIYDENSQEAIPLRQVSKEFETIRFETEILAQATGLFKRFGDVFLPHQQLNAEGFLENKRFNTPEKHIPTHLTDEEIERAVRIKEMTNRKRLGASQINPENQICDLSTLPINILFSDYTINTSGQVIPDGGWTRAERDWLTGYFCKVLPIIEIVYGDPYTYYDLTYVKDERYNGTNIFIPKTLEIHSAHSLPPKWHPQLVVHELLHAWRWQWVVSANHSLPNLYPNNLVPFEESFAQGASYAVMNLYTETYGQNDPHVGYYYWQSDYDWDSDFRNDISMSTINFWSESGGTKKVWERYEIGAELMTKLEINTPGFYKSFNLSYFNTIQNFINIGDPKHVFTKQEISNIIESVSNPIEGKSVLEWIDDQKLFDQEYTYGKKVWIYKSHLYLVNSHYHIYLLETFPNGREWYYYIPDLNGYVYHRMNTGVIGNLHLFHEWDNTLLINHQLIPQAPYKKYVPSDDKCIGIDCSYDFGFDYIAMQVYQPPSPASVFPVPNPITFQHPPEKGLYRYELSYNNPHFVLPPQTPKYGISYDALQTKASANSYALLGLTSNEFESNKIIGGIIGANSGAVTVSHNKVPSVSETCSVKNGLFLCSGKVEWYETILNGIVTGSKPGELTFTFQPESSSQFYIAKRIIDRGAFNGVQHFLFKLDEMIVQ